ncbi:MAG TPA: hypothetical protein VMM13_19905 [Euzebya sp.]|nr:hypothetical protein [Euzebya sp.]
MRARHRVVALLIALLLAAACTPTPQGAGGLNDRPPGEAAELAFAQCMREQGYDWPDPVYADGGWDTHIEEEIDYESPAFEAAEGVCAQVRADAAQADGPQAGQVAPELDEQMEAHLAFAACMREQGIDFPDPVLDGDTISGPAGPLDGDQAAFDAAREACEDPDS